MEFLLKKMLWVYLLPLSCPPSPQFAYKGKEIIQASDFSSATLHAVRLWATYLRYSRKKNLSQVFYIQIDLED